MFDGLFTTTQTKPKTNKRFEGLFDNVVSTSPVVPIIKTKGKLSDYLGGGSYNIGEQGKLATSTRGYAGIEAPGEYREHIFPVALGGTSDFNNIKVYGKDLGAKKSAYENVIIKRYQDKKISLPEARGLVLKKFRELTGLEPKQGIFNNLWSGIKQLGSDIKNIPSKIQKESEKFTTPLGLEAGITKETLRADVPKDRLATAGVLAGLAFPSKGIGMISEGLPGARGLSSLLSKGKKTTSLAQKATKLRPQDFATAEEFVKAQPTIYHGTPAKFEKFDTNISEGGASWFTSDKAEILSGKSGAVQGAGQKLNIMERYVKPDLKLATPKQADNLFTDQLISEGYRGVKYPATKESAEWTKLFYPNEDTITKSQLINIWNNANKGDIANELGFGKMPKVLTNLAESIAPIKQQNPIVQSTFKTWTRELLIGEEKANKQLAKIPQLADNFDTILKYEKGEPTKWTEIIKKEFDALHKKAQDLGITSFDNTLFEKTDLKYRKNYIPQVYNNTLEEVKTAMSKYMKDQGVSEGALNDYINGIKELPDEISKRLKLNPFFSKERAFPDYATAMKYGLTPKYTEPAQLLAHYEAELSKTVANRKFLDDLVSKGQVKTVEQAGQDWQALTLPFSPKGYYAPPDLAKMLNGMFRNEEMLGFGATVFKGLAGLSRTMQEVVLSAGVPKTNINFFAIGQLIKNLTAGEFKTAGAFIRSNFNAPSIKFFMDNGKTLENMANQGIDILKRVDGYTEIYKKLSDTKGIIKKVGLTWDKAFGEKTFKSFMPQMQVQTFKDVYTKALKKLPKEQAEKLAGDTVKAFYGLHENLGRGKGTEDVLSATFFAPKFREGIINTLFNTGKSITTEIFNPAFAKNRKLLAGMILSYAGYNALNKKLTGHYMWENPEGKEFDLQIPTKLGNTQDDVIYIGFMPSFLAFARNMASGGIALVKGDLPTAKQKLGSVFSMPIKVASEIWANKDYFGREIYKNYDDAKTKIKKIASYAFLSVNHPFIKEIYKQMTTDKPLYQSISEAMEMPLKFSSYTKIEQQEFYEAIRKQDAKEAKIKEEFRPRYTEVRDLLEAGKIDEATNLINSMTDDEYKIYKSLKRADKTRANVNQEIKIFNNYKQVQELMADGQTEEATAIVNKMTDEEYQAYKRLKNKLQ